MKLSALLAIGAGCLGLARQLTPGGRAADSRCGTTNPSREFLANARMMQRQAGPGRGVGDVAKTAGGKKTKAEQAGLSGVIQVPVFMHVVESIRRAHDITNDTLAKQQSILHNVFLDYGFNFTLVNVSYVIDDEIAVGPENSNYSTFQEYLKLNRRGSYGALNLYFYSDYPRRQFGRCELPLAGYNTNEPLNGTVGFDEDLNDGGPGGYGDEVHPDYPLYYWDACHINAGTMPGGNITDYNLGYTVVHEVGHWLGLLHTFQGLSCYGMGDYIDDTPQQSEATSGCPAYRKDSCSTKPGLDPIHNYMDYSSDACYTEFTRGQTLRMHDSFHMYRESY